MHRLFCRLYICLIAVIAVMPTYAYNFESGGIYYDIVGFNSLAVTYGDSKPTGIIDIPGNLTFMGRDYNVISIGKDAFSGCIGLTSIKIPNTVTSIESGAFSRCSGLTSISIPNSVTSIGGSAFSGCSALTSIKLSNNVKSIENSTFRDCRVLTTITIPSSVTSIGDYAFTDCGLTSVTIPSSVTSIGKNAFSCNGLTSYYVDSSNPSFTSASGVLFNKNKTVIVSYPVGKIDSGYLIPNSVISIGGYAFSGCGGLTSITIPNSVTSIGSSAFSGCSGLTSITIPNSVTSIENSTFSGCTGLTSITIPNGVTSIGSYVFSNCSGLASITISNSVTSIGDYAFSYCSGLSSIKVESGNTKYDSRNDCNAIIETASNTLIMGCKNTTIPNSVTSIASSAFSYCNALTSITIPESVEKIEKYAFTNCSGLTSIISKKTEPFYVDYYVFSSEIYSTATLYVPLDTKSAYKKMPYWYEFKNIVEIEESNTSPKRTINVPKAGTLKDSISESEKYTIEELTLTGELNGTDFRLLRDMAGNNYLGQNTSGKLRVLDLTNAKVVVGGEKYLDTDNIHGNGISSYGYYHYDISQNNEMPQAVFFGCYLRVIHFPNTVTCIKESAFEYCRDLPSITIPNSVTSIGSSAFSNCSGLTSITIPYSVTSIGNGAFSNCSGLTSINVESGNTIYDSRNNCNAIIETSSNTLIAGCKITTIPNSVTSIGNHAFDGCNGLTSISIPSSVTSIGNYAFMGCSGLPFIMILGSVTSIGNHAFYGCSGLTSISIPNSVTSIGVYAFRGCSELKDIISEIKTPFEIDENVFSVYSAATLTVPNGTKSAYQSTAGWKNFTNIKESAPSQVSFTDQGITYLGTISTLKAEVQFVNDGNVVIPATVVYNGSSYDVTSIADGVLSNRTFDYVSLPSTITSLESSTFSNSTLGALIWNADTSLPSNVISNMAMPTTSNFLLYVNKKEYAPSNVSNVVVGNTASSIVLKDGINTRFYCPKSFTAQTISYTHHYGMMTGGNGKGWETIALPFDVQKIEHKTKGEITPFASYQSGSGQRPFWLYEFGSNGFRRTDAIKANTPYIIAMPNDTKYDEEYILAGDVTFSATNATVIETGSLTMSISNGKTFIPAFAVEQKASTIYALNVSNELTVNTTSYDPGSRFVPNLRQVYPFEAYMTSSSSARSLVIEFEDELTGFDEVPLKEQRSGIVKVYTLTGLLMFSVPQSEFADKWQSLPSGVYIVNGQKMIKLDAQYNIVQ